MSLNWLINSRRSSSRGSRSRSPGQAGAKLRVEELEQREMLDASSGTKPPIRHPGPVPVFDQTQFVNGLYFDLLHRQPQQAEVAGWASALYAGASKGQVVLGFLNSDEYRINLIRQDYQMFLGRDADAGGLEGWLTVLRQGKAAQDLMAAFVLSAEYYQKQGGNIQAWVNALYRDVLGRPADVGGFGFWTQSLQNGVPRSTVALAFVHGQEENARLVTDVYQNLLGRTPDAGGLQNWVTALARGFTLTQLNAAIALSTEYVNLQLNIVFASAAGDTPGSSGGAVNRQSTRFVSRAQSKGSLTVGPNVDVNRETGDQTEETVAVDPNNPLRVFISSNEDNIADGDMAAYSMDGGVTWTPYVIGTGPLGDGLPLAVSDPWAAWDEFGNLFYTYLSESFPGSGRFFLAVLLSTDGGKTFQSISNNIPIDDHPEVTAANGIVAATFHTPSPSSIAGHVEVAMADVSGLGQVGPFFVQVVPNSDAKSFGDIAIGPAGQIVVSFQSNTSGRGPDTVEVSLDPNVLGASRFGNPTVATSTNVGSFRPITPQPVRSVPANDEIVYDRSNSLHKGRLYLSYADAPNTTSSNLNIFVRFSDDDGKTWSQPVQVNDDSGNAVHFFPAIAVDQSSGNVAVCWYDTRNDTGSGPGDRPHKVNTDVEVFASVSTDGGQTFLPNVQIASGPSNATLNMDTGGNDFGDYMGLGFSHGVFYPAWADNSTTLAGNPNRPNFDIATAKVIVSGAGSTSGGGGTTFVPRPPDRFDPNETSDRAFSFGVLSGSQTITNLLISRLPDGLVDNNWWRWQAGQTGTFTVQIDYKSFDGGDLHLRLFTLNSQGQLIQLGSSRATRVTSQKVSVPVTAGAPLFAWVYGLNHSEATYQMTVTLG